MARVDLVTGFTADARLVRAVARSLGVRASLAKTGAYGAGEHWVTGPARCPDHVLVVSDVTADPASLFRVLLLAEALRAQGARQLTLLAPWIAYGRQDRATFPGEASAGAVVGRALGRVFRRIVTLDAHSPAFVRSFRGRLVNVLPDSAEFHRLRMDIHAVAAPDRGAEMRAGWVARALGVPLAIVEKKRVNGTVIGARLVPASRASIRPRARVLLVDDIGDSGGTLIAAAHALRKAGAGSTRAVVSHAPDGAALRRAVRGTLSGVTVLYDHRSGALSSRVLQALIKRL